VGISFTSVDAFTPETTAVMSAAFDSAWVQLAAAGRVETTPFRAEATRERIASAIIGEARKGITDPGILVAAALASAFAEHLSRRSIESRRSRGATYMGKCMDRFGGKSVVAAVIVMFVSVLVFAVISMNSDTGGPKVDRNVPGATTGAGKASLTD
jgi:hypothetical protein